MHIYSKSFLYDPIFFLVQQSIELFFTPKNIHLKPKNSKLDNSFLDTL